jgi:lipopolysaccharide export system protein LptA
MLRSAVIALLVMSASGLVDLSRPAVAQAAKEPATKQEPAKKQKGGTVVPNALQGISRNRKDPVKIEANALEVRDRDKTAVFMGNVLVTQGETSLRCRELKVIYEGENLTTQTTAAAGTPAQRIRRLEVVGGVIIASKDQKATGDSGVYDLRANTMTLNGNVVVTQGPNVMQGDRLIVELATGRSRLEAGGKPGPGRVKGLFVPSSVRDGQPQDAAKGSSPRTN